MTAKGCFLAVISTFAYLTGCYPAPPSTEAQARPAAHEGLKLLNALHQFRNDNGKYPETLDSLIPKYMDKSFSEEVGVRWFYNPDPAVHSPFYLAKKLGWDESAEWRRDEGKQSVWWYDKGDGSGKGFEFRIDRPER